jgi:hypothetical protein
MHRGFNSVRAARCGITEHIYQITIEFTQPSKTPYRKLNSIYIDGDKTVDRLYIPKHKLLLCRLDWLGRHGSYWWAFGRHGVWSLHPSRWTWPMKLATERPLMRCWWTQAVYFWGAWCPGGSSFSFPAFRGRGDGKATRGGHIFCSISFSKEPMERKQSFEIKGKGIYEKLLFNLNACTSFISIINCTDKRKYIIIIQSSGALLIRSCLSIVWLRRQRKLHLKSSPKRILV